MALDAKQAALTAINEAIRVLDYDIVGEHPADGMVELAMDSLMSARELLTDKPWPELSLPDGQELEAWVAARTAEQLQDGRQ